MHARMHVSGRSGPKLCRFCRQKARPPAPHYAGRSIHDRLGLGLLLLSCGTIHTATSGTIRQYLPGDCPRPGCACYTFPTTAREVAPTLESGVQNGSWQLALYWIRLFSLCILLPRGCAWSQLQLRGTELSLVKPLGPRIEQLTQTLGRGPRLVPGLSSANGCFVFVVVEPTRVKKTARAPCPFFPACLAGCHR